MVSKRNSEKKEKAFKLKWIYESFGISKQAYYQQITREKIRDLQREKIIDWVINYRKELPKTGPENFTNIYNQKCSKPI